MTDEPNYKNEISAFEEKVLQGYFGEHPDVGKITVAKRFIKVPEFKKNCPKCDRLYNESRCAQCKNPTGCAYCHLQMHVVKRNG